MKVILTMFKVYSIKDIKVDAFMQPFFLPTDGAALRAFGDEVKKSDSNLHQHPEDYVLYALGVWDDQIGSLQPFDAPRSLGVASEYVGSGQAA